MVDEQYSGVVNNILEKVVDLESSINRGEIEIPQGEKTAQVLGRHLSELLFHNGASYSNTSVQEALYSVVFRCLVFLPFLNDKTYFNYSLIMLIEFAWIKKPFSLEEIDQIIFIFEKAVNLYIMELEGEKKNSPVTGVTVLQQIKKKHHDRELPSILFSFLRILDLLHERYFDQICRSIDSILVASSYTSTKTVMDRYGTHNNIGIKLLNKMSRKNPQSLYPFVQDLFEFSSTNPVMMDEIMSIFSYIAAKNALIFKDKVDQFYNTSRSVNQSRVYQITTTILSRVGRVDSPTARKCQLCLIQFLKDEVDMNLNYAFLDGMFNIAGVYKKSLEKQDLEFLREFTRQQSDLRLSEVIQKMLDYYANPDLNYMKDAFLQDQRDILGRFICLVDEKIDAKLGNIESSIVKLQERTEKIEDVLYIHQEDLDRLKGQVTQLGDRMNVVEVANVLMEEQMKEMNENLEELANKVMNQQSQLKEFMAMVVKKIPIPSSYVAKGKIRKRLILTFKCSQGREPDFVMETADWSKWIKVVFIAAQTVQDAASFSMLGLLQDLKSLYDGLMTSGFDGKTRFNTLIS
eukprot:gene4213-4512_t